MGISIPFGKKNGGQKRISSKERVERAEAAFMSLLEERKKLEQLILDACIRLQDMGFTEPSSGMKLENAAAFKDLLTFAKGTPDIYVPLLDSLDKDGKRFVKRWRTTENIGHELQLECGHSLRLSLSQKLPEKDQRVMCDRCIAMLKERGDHEEAAETPPEA